MAFHVYVEPDLESKLDALCRQSGKKRNTVVREALREYVEKNLERSWPKSLSKLKPDISLVPFESLRGDLLPDRDDIFEQ